MKKSNQKKETSYEGYIPFDLYNTNEKKNI